VALRELGLGNLLNDCHRIPAAAYRSRDGAWLSRCSDTPANRVAVATLRESELLASLEASLPQGTVRRGASLAAVREEEDGVAVQLEDGHVERGTVVVGADGVGSAVRRFAFAEPAGAAIDTGKISFSGILSPTAIASLSDSGGRTDAHADSLAYAFETLSAGRRFAVVPLADGGAFWFATLGAGGGIEGADASCSVAALRAAYNGWHEPIPRLLHAVACEVAEAAMAAGGGAAADDGAAAGAPPLRCDRLHVTPRTARWWAGRAVLVGDAAHALPINLAQGAACAIEGAFTLSAALADALGGSRAGAPLETAVAAAAFARYQAGHEARVRQCRVVTAFTELLAAPASPPTEALRNAIRLVPRPLNGWIFDTALELSLGDRPARTRAMWPLATAC
jgi:2-polyprenyl-6-methoxyphenol hydroxylase-like FAD-dependent oxidoreductase